MKRKFSLRSLMRHKADHPPDPGQLPRVRCGVARNQEKSRLSSLFDAARL